MRRAAGIDVRALLALTLMLLGSRAHAADWPRFRGADGSGAAPADARVPAQWSADSNILWKTPLPGPGSSSPVTFRDHAYVACYSGYGLSKDSPGNMADLRRHLVCIRLADGGVAWTATLPRSKPEHPYESFIVRHGYASSTPVVDESGVYVYYGTSGLHAYTLKGEPRWNKSCGERNHNFGSAASPILYKDLVIINADTESGAIVALKKTDGTEAWRYRGPDMVPNNWCTPIVVALPTGDELVTYGTQDQAIALDPATGKVLWTCTIPMNSYQDPSPIAHGGVVYFIGDHPGNAVAIRTGGRGDVTKSHLLWNLKKGSVVSSPVYHEGHVYWAHEENGRAYCVEAATGKVVYEQSIDPKPGLIYASAVLANGRIYYTSQKSGTYVIEARPQYKLLHRNVIESDESTFNGSPAIHDGKILLRSDKFLYRIGEKR